MSYIITNNVKDYKGFLLKQVRYSNGELGGWVIGEGALGSNAYIGPEVMVFGAVSGVARVEGKSIIDGIVQGNARVYDSHIRGVVKQDVIVNNSVIYRDAIISGKSEISNAFIHDVVEDGVKIIGTGEASRSLSVNTPLRGKLIIEGKGSIGSNARIWVQEDYVYTKICGEDVMIYKTQDLTLHCSSSNPEVQSMVKRFIVGNMYRVGEYADAIGLSAAIGEL
jgi:hypothetical protein